MKHIVLFSGGIGSWGAARRVIVEHGPDDVILLFTDTKTEDADLYRFIEQAATNLGGTYTPIAEGRNIWQVFKDVGYMGNSRRDPCSMHLKRNFADAWIKRHFTPDECICYIGIDWTEVHRYDRMAPRKLPYIYKAPLIEPPYLTKAELLADLRAAGIEPPRLYAMGFPHNNCGGFCVRAGQAHFKLLWEKRPDYYLACEREENEVYKTIGKRHPFIRVVQDGIMRYLSLQDFREELLEPKVKIDCNDFGGCGCFLEDADDEVPVASTA